jgi:hypothetical protein
MAVTDKAVVENEEERNEGSKPDLYAASEKN